MIKPSRINTKLHIAGGSLSLIIIAIIVLTVMMNEKSKKDALIINISGKQRMLTQKMSKEIFYIKQKQQVDFRELNAAIDTFGTNLLDLMDGNNIKGIYPPQEAKIREKLEEVSVQWEPFRTKLLEIQSAITKEKPLVEVFTQRVTTMLEKSDAIVQVMVAHQMEGKFIDLSGRQRMLSQRMGLFVERYLRTDNENDFQQFLKAKNLYSQTIQSFIDDPKVKAIAPVYKSVKDAYEYWSNYEKYLDELLSLSHELNIATNYIYEKNIKILNTMDDAVWLYTQYSEDKNVLFVRFLYLSLIVTLLIILYAFILSRQIVGHINDFVSRAKLLEKQDLSKIDHENIVATSGSEDELIEASGYISNFVRKVNIAMSHSEDAIKKAELAVLELENLADNVEETLKELKMDENAKHSLDKKVNATEDIAIESAESLMYVRKMLEKLKSNLNSMVAISQKDEDKF